MTITLVDGGEVEAGLGWTNTVGGAQLQSILVRTGASAYQFVAENSTAYLTQNVSGDFVRVGFGFHYRAEDWTEQQTYGTLVRQNRLMTSATTPAPSVVTASGAHPSHAEWKTFDGTTATGWYLASSYPYWIQYDHGAPIPVSRYILRAVTNGGYISHFPNNFQLLGSDDGITWTTVNTQTGRNTNSSNTPSTSSNFYTINLPQTYMYRYWRLVVTHTPSGAIAVGDLELWGGTVILPVLPIAQVCAADGTIRASLQLDSQTHHLKVVNGTGTLLAETTRAFESDNWYYLEWSHSLTGGELRFNGATEVTWNNAVATVDQLRLGIVTTKTVGFFMDDIIVSTGENWPGPVRCHLLQPNEDIEETGWSRLPADAPTAHSTLTDADDTSYLYSQQGVIRVCLEDLPDQNEILAVQVMSRMSVDAEGQTDIDFLLNETIVDTQTLTTTPTWYTHVASVNPVTDAAWTVGDVNVLGVGWMVVVVPDAPTNLAVIQDTEEPTNFDVTFDFPTYTGGADIIEYQVEIVTPTSGEIDFMLPMTANNTPSPYVASSSSSSSAEYAAYKAFDGLAVDNNGWFSANTGQPWWLKIDLGVAHIVTAFLWSPYRVDTYSADNFPKDWQFQGSNDNVNWTVLTSATNYTIAARDTRVDVPNSTAYRYYRWYITRTINAGYSLIGEIRLLKNDEAPVETQIGASSPITFLAKPYNISYDVRVRARNLKGWGEWAGPISYLHQDTG